jgi:hypothetical protein
MHRIRALLSETGKLERAIEREAAKKTPGWYRVERIWVEKRNPINDYRIELVADSNPPPP